MKIQGILDLSGFELQNFCIQNYTDKANVANLGRGRKFFFTGNSTDQDYHRELIYDGSSWRATAYLDDIAKVNEKLDLIFGDELDTDTIIDSWKEVQDFLSGIEDTKNLMTMLDGKLDKTGGTIKGDNDIPLTISQPNDGNTWIKFANAYRTLGYIGFSLSAGLAMMPNDGSKTYSLLHEGNVGEYTAGAANHLNSTEVSGEGSDSILDDIFTKKSGISVNIARNLGSGSLFVSRDTIVVNYSWGGRYGQQWAIEDTSHKILVRTKNADQTGAVWSDWKTIAFTDSNVASATKLETSRAIWGQSFDGTGNVTGDLYLSPATNDGNALSTRLVFSGYSGMPFGPFIGTTSTSTGGYGRKNLVFMQRNETSWATDFKSHTIAMLINPFGNVSIGDSDRAGENIKLFVSGSVQIASGDLMLGNFCTIRSYKSDRLTLNTLIALTDKDLLVINQDGDVPTYIRGGNVGIGVLDPKYKLDVAGIGNFSSRVLIGGATDDGTSALQVNGHTVIKNNFDYNAFDTSGNKVSLLGVTSQDKVVFGIGAYYYQLPSALYGKTIELKSGSNVLAASFDEKGLSTFHQGALIPTGQKLTIGDANGDHATIEYDSIAKAIKVDGNLFTTGTNASGGKADAQQGGTGGNAEVYKYDLDRGKQVYEIQNVKGDVNVNVQVYEWNGNGNSWDMILTDVSVTANIIIVTFGRPTSVNHMVTVV